MNEKEKQSKKKHVWIETIVVGSIAAALIAYSIFPYTFIDPDAWYHIAVTQIMLDTHSVITDFPWLQFTTLKDAYVDHHLLYHIFLMPFIGIFGSFAGMKIATIFFGGAVIGIIFFLLRKWNVSGAFWWALLCTGLYDFIFRISLSKGNSVSLLFLFVGFFLVIRKKIFALSVISFFYVWAYGGFVQILILACVSTCVDLLLLVVRKKRIPTKKELWQSIRVPLASGAGLCAGLLIHPSFPNNIAFLWEQVVHIAIVNYQDTIGVGAEWYPRAFDDLFFGSMMMTALFLLALITALRHPRKMTPEALTSGVMTLFYLALTLKSQRSIEYAMPWIVIWAALTTHAAGILPRTKDLLSHIARRSTFGAVIVCAVTLSGVGVITHTIYETSTQLRRVSESATSFDHFAGIGNWLTTHAEPEAIIFHDDWDSFPLLFHHAPSMHYIVGLDPTFFYRYDPALYAQWAAITVGKEKENLEHTIGKTFNATYVVVDRDHTAFEKNIRTLTTMEEVYSDADGTIFAVKPSLED